MTGRRNLHVVAPEPERIDINALIRADIGKRDWAGMHIAADRRPFLAWADVPKRIWRK